MFFSRIRKAIGAVSLLALASAVIWPLLLSDGGSVETTPVLWVVALGFLAYLVACALTFIDMIKVRSNSFGTWALAIYIVWHILVTLLSYDLDYQWNILLVLDPGLIFVILFEDLTSLFWKPNRGRYHG